MTLKKRGLGRGLEALLAEDSVKEEPEPVSVATNKDDHHSLQQEAEDLRKLIEDIESMVRDDPL